MSFPQPPDRPDDAPPSDPAGGEDRSAQGTGQGSPWSSGAWSAQDQTAQPHARTGPGQGAWPPQGNGPGQGAWPVQSDGPGQHGPPPSNGLATAGLVLGVVALVLFWTVVLGLILGILAVVFGAIGMKRASTLPGRHLWGRGLAGVITGAAAILLSGAFLVLALIGFVGEIDSDPADGTCDEGRFLQDPDC